MKLVTIAWHLPPHGCHHVVTARTRNRLILPQGMDVVLIAVSVCSVSDQDAMMTSIDRVDRAGIDLRV